MKAKQVTWALVGMIFCISQNSEGFERKGNEQNRDWQVPSPGANPPSPSTPKAMTDQQPIQQERQVQSMQRDDAIRAQQAQQQLDAVRAQQQERAAQTMKQERPVQTMRLEQPGARDQERSMQRSEGETPSLPERQRPVNVQTLTPGVRSSETPRDMQNRSVNLPSPSIPRGMADQPSLQQERQVQSMQRGDAIRAQQAQQQERAAQTMKQERSVQTRPVRPTTLDQERSMQRSAGEMRALPQGQRPGNAGQPANVQTITPAVRSANARPQEPGRDTQTPSVSRQDWKRVFQDSNRVQGSAIQQPRPEGTIPSMVSGEIKPRDQKIERPVQMRERQAPEQLQQYVQRQKQNSTANESQEKQQEFKAALPERERSERAAAIQNREQIARSYPDYRRWFDDTFFERHNRFPVYHSYGDNWWRRTNWIVITNWLPWGWGSPMYYYGDYGVTLPAEIDGGGNIFPAGNWLPLGVFAVYNDLGSNSAANLFFQLAVNKAGEIGGTIYIASTDQIYDLDGVVDRETQQAVWRVSNDLESPILSVGIYNLTQDVATTLVAFPDGTQQTWYLTRINQ